MKVVLCFSGGLDSTVLLWHLKAGGGEVYCLSVDYGQRHRRELLAAAELSSSADCPHLVADLGGLQQVGLFKGSSQTDPTVAVPDGHYAEESMKQTVVPNRNMLLLSVATCWAVSLKADAVAYAAHAGDHAIYPDCRPEFTEAMEDAIRLCDWHPVRLLRPFLYPCPMDKTAIVRRGAELGAPLGKTWSCYRGGNYHCGTCGTCVERKEAFQLAGVADPTVYLIDHRVEA